MCIVLYVYMSMHYIFLYSYASRFVSFLVNAQIAQINSLFKRVFKYGYVKSVITVEELLESYDDQLFHKASYSNHCLHHLLPVAKSVNYVLRDGGCWTRFVNRSCYV